MNGLKKYIAENYNHADLLVTVGVFAAVYFGWRAPTVNLTEFGECIGAIIACRGIHAAGTGWAHAQGGGQ